MPLRLLHRLLCMKADDLVVKVGIRHKPTHSRLILCGLMKERSDQLTLLHRGPFLPGGQHNTRCPAYRPIR